MSRFRHQLNHGARIAGLGYHVLRGGVECLEPRVLLSRNSFSAETTDASARQAAVDTQVVETRDPAPQSVAVNEGLSGTAAFETLRLADAMSPEILIAATTLSPTSIALQMPTSKRPVNVTGAGNPVSDQSADALPSQTEPSPSFQQQTGSNLQTTSSHRQVAMISDEQSIAPQITDAAAGFGKQREALSVAVVTFDGEARVTRSIANRIERDVERTEFEHTKGQAEQKIEKPASHGDSDQAETAVRPNHQSAAHREQVAAKKGSHESKSLLAASRAMTDSAIADNTGTGGGSVVVQASIHNPDDETVPPNALHVSSPGPSANNSSGRGANANARDAAGDGSFGEGIAEYDSHAYQHLAVTQESDVAQTSTNEDMSLAPTALLTVSLGQPLSRLAVALDGAATATPVPSGSLPAAGSLGTKRRRSRRDSAKRSKRSPDDELDLSDPSPRTRDLNFSRRQSTDNAITPWSPPAGPSKTAWLKDAAIVSLTEPSEPRETPDLFDQVLHQTFHADAGLAPLEVIAIGSGGAALARGVVWLAKERMRRGRAAMYPFPALPSYNGPTLDLDV